MDNKMRKMKLSELQTRFIDDTYCEYYKTGKHDLAQVYLKPEADKVIADLEESHKMEVEQLLMEIVGLKADYREACGRLQTANLIKDEQLAATRHSKYKRCLVMAKWCDEKWLVHNFAEVPTKLGFYDKWQKRWLALAERFKEAK